jgi:dTMP kinase
LRSAGAACPGNALNQDNVVLCDRFSDATYAYQGAARGLNPEFIRVINEYSSMGLKPNLTLLFDLPVEIGLQRATERDNRLKDSSFSDRFERESLNFHNKVREGYLNILKKEPERFRLIDATGDINKIQEEVCRYITDFIGLAN